MLRLSEGTAIALHAIVYINNKKDPATVKEISAKFGISDNHLSKILQRFVKEGILVSGKGPKGGFSINEEYRNMSLMAVYELFEGEFEFHKCLFNNKNGDCIECIMSDIVTKMEKEFVEYMTKKKISDFTKCQNLNV